MGLFLLFLLFLNELINQYFLNLYVLIPYTVNTSRYNLHKQNSFVVLNHFF